MTLPELHQKIEENQIKGFLAGDEAEALFNFAYMASGLGPCLEVGSYCGKSSVFLGAAVQITGSLLFAIDHHRGSEEHQVGEEYHDRSLFDSNTAQMDTLPEFRNTIESFGLVDSIVPILSSSETVSRYWRTPLALVFIDGGHSHQASLHDCTQWSRHILPGGYLLIHDIFEKPEEGGQGPFLAMKAVLDSGGFEYLEKVNSMGVLRRL